MNILGTINYEDGQPKFTHTYNNASSWVFNAALNNPNLKISKQGENYFLKVDGLGLDIILSEKNLIDWIVKLEMAIQ